MKQKYRCAWAFINCFVVAVALVLEFSSSSGINIQIIIETKHKISSLVNSILLYPTIWNRRKRSNETWLNFQSTRMNSWIVSFMLNISICFFSLFTLITECVYLEVVCSKMLQRHNVTKTPTNIYGIYTATDRSVIHILRVNIRHLNLCKI